MQINKHKLKGGLILMGDRIGPGTGTGPFGKARRRELEDAVNTAGQAVEGVFEKKAIRRAFDPQPDPGVKKFGIADVSNLGLPPGARPVGPVIGGGPGGPIFGNTPGGPVFGGAPVVPGPTAEAAKPSRFDKAGYLTPGQPMSAFAQEEAGKISTSPELGDTEFIEKLYMEAFGKVPQPDEVDTVSKQLASGITRQDLITGFTSSPQFQMAQDIKEGNALGPIATVPDDGQYDGARLDTSSVEAAVESAAKWAQETSPDIMAKINATPPPNKQQEDRLFYELTTKAIGALRANGLDVERLGRHTQHDVGNPARYVNDAIVLPDGRAIDIFGGGENHPQFHDLDVKSPKTDRNTGITDPGARRTSSTSSEAEEVEASFKDARLDKSSLEAAVLSAARWAKATSPDLFAMINADPPPNKQKENKLFYDLMTKVIGALKANGYDVERLARHTQNEVGNPNRYVNDALVLPDGRAIDVFGGGENEPQFHDLDVRSPKTDKNTGVTPVGAPLSSSTSG